MVISYRNNSLSAEKTKHINEVFDCQIDVTIYCADNDRNDLNLNVHLTYNCLKFML